MLLRDLGDQLGSLSDGLESQYGENGAEEFRIPERGRRISDSSTLSSAETPVTTVGSMWSNSSLLPPPIAICPLEAESIDVTRFQ